MSLSARRAWIEIRLLKGSSCLPIVALRKESVDRNARKIRFVAPDVVALRKESVDRNFLELLPWGVWGAVALRKESVDRNKLSFVCKWDTLAVALRKESVDRNVNLRVVDGSKSVALRKESVDRNGVFDLVGDVLQRRSPQGERG